MIFFLFSSFFPPSARSIIVHFRFASFSIRAPVSATWPNNASQRKIERARGTKISVHRGSRVRDARPTLGATGGGREGGRSRYHWNTLERKKRGGAHRGKLICREPLSTPFLHDKQKRKNQHGCPSGCELSQAPLSSRPVFETIFSSPLLS